MVQNSKSYDIIIIGGGLAGLSCAIHLSKADLNVLVIEKNTYPKHKVCGEYISNEVLPYLEYLGIEVFALGAKQIDRFELSTVKSQSISTSLPLGGFGISRYCIDNALVEKAQEKGAKLLRAQVKNVQYADDKFNVVTNDQQHYTAKLVIGAYGKRSNLDVKLNRQFIQRKSPYLAVKTHVNGTFPDDLVALHNFEGGYCGVSKVETNAINLCYITSYKSFKKHKSIEDFQEQIIFKNKFLKDIFESTTPVFDQPLTISQISFEDKKPVEHHIIMCGDTAALIHPLCGNGMGMAIKSAQMASQLIIKWFNGTIDNREALEKQYLREWNAAFKKRLKTGRIVAKLFNKPRLSEFLLQLLKLMPGLLPHIIKRTHGKVMQIE
ncbi:NAD(P)/FAD-dependent oxidoreductase [Psychroserpens sp.]|uniref:NAD(P)/FAD-dependent oxidoreductase n=1 Tax=Psychroserpens sp. TaxID=2020870 RepID=UPI001B09594B|nr:NAD(P)/FAD-dependent oxidoreductase [Psychroserpens sp.]MBO6605294.1 NAD(P)/FAD-dependent oxidoreductase [Psychroserpens sp.]MBO6631724.1 NAD(P)/FAD-dependent oxidoreductase [Psychroserpens sp.]MBO6653897.1 NAD(P)/FAD-dependent oxidoreductase [Psychroserpens sp.]MBO6682218.1 NAD(P)/FAD-dependent oxidoreductase [Psychroserpens sp.]MBO6748668.1 NAD(P)/FAD-dependent oxidoreductase [Psychroserpens sp.]